jgi:hypothetical protein
MPDAVANFAYSSVATAPSPATSGTSLVVAAGTGTRYPAVPFNATVWPAGGQPLSSNAEIVRVTAIAMDTLTIVRTQEGTTARTIIVGDQIIAGVTAKTITDLNVGAPYLSGQYYLGSVVTNADTNPFFSSSLAAGTLYGVPFTTFQTTSLNQVAFVVNTAGATGSVARVILYQQSPAGLGNVAFYTATIPVDSAGTKLTTVAWDVPPGDYWLGIVTDATTLSIRCAGLVAGVAYGPMTPSVASDYFNNKAFVQHTFTGFTASSTPPSPGPATIARAAVPGGGGKDTIILNVRIA